MQGVWTTFTIVLTFIDGLMPKLAFCEEVLLDGTIYVRSYKERNICDCQFKNVFKSMKTLFNNLYVNKRWFQKGKKNAHELFSEFTCKCKKFSL